MDLLSLRTLLFTPGNQPDRFGKAKESGADGIVIDLEDAIALSEKDKTRAIVINYFNNLSSSPERKFYHCLRINSLKTPAGIKDISAILESDSKPDALILPKIEYPAEVIILDELLRLKKIPYLVTIESALGLHHADNIATSSSAIKAICFGGADLAADLGVNVAWEPLLAARSLLIKSAAIAGIVPLDMPYLKLHQPDTKELRHEAEKVKALGYQGKFAIHPEQISTLLEVFSPTDTEIKNARAIVQAYDLSKGEVCEINGKMIDVPIFRHAQRILAKVNLGRGGTSV